MAQESNLVRNIVIAVVIGLAVVILISMLSGSPRQEEQAADAPIPGTSEGRLPDAVPEPVSPTAPRAALAPGASPEPPRVARPLPSSNLPPDAGRALARGDRQPHVPMVDAPGDPDYIDPKTLEPMAELPPELANQVNDPKPEIPEALRISLDDEPLETPPDLLRAMEEARYLETPPEIMEAEENARYLETPPELLEAGTGQ